MDKILCVITKIIDILIILLSFLLIPFELYLKHQQYILSDILLMLFISVIFFIFGWMQLLKTNNPTTRYNPFSLNPKFNNKMVKSMNEDPSQLFKLDNPIQPDIRNKKIKQIWLIICILN